MTSDRASMLSRGETDVFMKESPLQRRSAPSRGQVDKRKWLMSYGSFGEIEEEEDTSRHLESSASGAVLEVIILFTPIQQPNFFIFEQFLHSK